MIHSWMSENHLWDSALLLALGSEIELRQSGLVVGAYCLLSHLARVPLPPSFIFCT